MERTDSHEQSHHANAMPSANPDLVARNVSFETYMAQYAAEHHEWVQGNIYKLPPINERHDEIDRYIQQLLSAYLAVKPIGKIRADPFVMKLSATGIGRQPDIQIILGHNQNNLTPTYMNGAADIVIEIVSPESIQRDYNLKRSEYEASGVLEYWILDSIENKATFLRRNAHENYQEQVYSGIYVTPLLPCFQFDTSVLWLPKLPSIFDAVAAVNHMLTNCADTSPQPNPDE